MQNDVPSIVHEVETKRDMFDHQLIEEEGPAIQEEDQEDK